MPKTTLERAIDLIVKTKNIREYREKNIKKIYVLNSQNEYDSSWSSLILNIIKEELNNPKLREEVGKLLEENSKYVEREFTAEEQKEFAGYIKKLAEHDAIIKELEEKIRKLVQNDQKDSADYKSTKEALSYYERLKTEFVSLYRESIHKPRIKAQLIERQALPKTLFRYLLVTNLSNLAQAKQEEIRLSDNNSTGKSSDRTSIESSSINSEGKLSSKEKAKLKKSFEETKSLVSSKSSESNSEDKESKSPKLVFLNDKVKKNLENLNNLIFTAAIKEKIAKSLESLNQYKTASENLKLAKQARKNAFDAINDFSKTLQNPFFNATQSEIEELKQLHIDINEIEKLYKKTSNKDSLITSNGQIDINKLKNFEKEISSRIEILSKEISQLDQERKDRGINEKKRLADFKEMNDEYDVVHNLALKKNRQKEYNMILSKIMLVTERSDEKIPKMYQWLDVEKKLQEQSEELRGITKALFLLMGQHLNPMPDHKKENILTKINAQIQSKEFQNKNIEEKIVGFSALFVLSDNNNINSNSNNNSSMLLKQMKDYFNSLYTPEYANKILGQLLGKLISYFDHELKATHADIDFREKTKCAQENKLLDKDKKEIIKSILKNKSKIKKLLTNEHKNIFKKVYRAEKKQSDLEAEPQRKSTIDEISVAMSELEASTTNTNIKSNNNINSNGSVPFPTPNINSNGSVSPPTPYNFFVSNENKKDDKENKTEIKEGKQEIKNSNSNHNSNSNSNGNSNNDANGNSGGSRPSSPFGF